MQGRVPSHSPTPLTADAYRKEERCRPGKRRLLSGALPFILDITTTLLSTMGLFGEVTRTVPRSSHLCHLHGLNMVSLHATRLLCTSFSFYRQNDFMFIHLIILVEIA